MSTIIRLATRSSQLALWQANTVADRLRETGLVSEIKTIASSGDVDLVNPIYEMGVQGVFTRELDMALLNNEADIAVHSLKDVPVVPAKGLTVAAVLPRANVYDVLIHKGKLPASDPFVVATSSIRRRSQWLQRYPNHTTTNIRGNVQTRIEKLNTSSFDGLIMAKAAIDRMNIQLKHAVVLDWMLPAPGQGAIAIVCRAKDQSIFDQLQKVSHEETMIAIRTERDFLHELKGGCSAPISALATIIGNEMNITAAIHSLDGRRSVSVKRHFTKSDFAAAGRYCAEEVLESAEGRSILEDIFGSKPELRS